MTTGKARYNVYVALLDPAAMRHRRFVDQNPNPRAAHDLPLRRHERPHPRGALREPQGGHKGNTYVRKYGISLLPAPYERLNPMTFAGAQATEARLADELRSAGYAVWQR